MATTTLSFTQVGNEWQAEATVTGDYNLHLEREGGGSLNIFQRATASGQYMVCTGMPDWLERHAGQVIDWAFGHGVYPEGGLHILIKSGSKVTGGTLSTAGEAGA